MRETMSARVDHSDLTIGFIANNAWNSPHIGTALVFSKKEEGSYSGNAQFGGQHDLVAYDACKQNGEIKRSKPHGRTSQSIDRRVSPHTQALDGVSGRQPVLFGQLCL